MKRDFKIFNNINTDLSEFDNKPLNIEEINTIKSRFHKKLKQRKKCSKGLVASVAIFLLLTSVTLTNETALANIIKTNETILAAINKTIGKFKDDKSTVLFENKISHKIVIYNTHNDETYNNGMSVVDVGEKINKTLNEMNLDSIHINSQTIDYIDSYDYANALVQNNIKNIKNSFLLDIHRGIAPLESDKETPTFTFILSKSSEYFEENKKLAEMISDEIIKISELDVKIHAYNKGLSNFNQDLSPHSITLDIGNEESSSEDIEFAINVFSKALNNILSKSQ